jgi:hypothetical protein
MKGEKAAAWGALVAVVVSIYLPRWHMIRMRRRLERLALSRLEGI